MHTFPHALLSVPQDPALWSLMRDVISVAEAVVAISTPFWHYWRTRTKLVCVIRAKRLADSSLWEVFITLKNIGRLPIREDDFQPPGQPISFEFGQANVLRVELVESQPSHLQPSLMCSGSRVLLSPLLLNQCDRVVFRVLVYRYAGLQAVTSRIAKVPSISVRIAGRLLGIKSVSIMVADLLLRTVVLYMIFVFAWRLERADSLMLLVMVSQLLIYLKGMWDHLKLPPHHATSALWPQVWLTVILPLLTIAISDVVYMLTTR